MINIYQYFLAEKSALSGAMILDLFASFTEAFMVIYQTNCQHFLVYLYLKCQEKEFCFYDEWQFIFKCLQDFIG